MLDETERGRMWTLACGEGEVLWSSQAASWFWDGVALGEYIEVSATYGGLNVAGEDATAWGKETDGEEGQALDTPDCHGGRAKASL